VIYDPSRRLDIGLTWASHATAALYPATLSQLLRVGVATSDVLNLQRPIFNSWYDDAGNLNKKFVRENQNDIRLFKNWAHFWLGVKKDDDEKIFICL